MYAYYFLHVLCFMSIMFFSQHILMPGMQTVQSQIQQTNVQQQQPNIQSQLSQLNQSQMVLQGSSGTINLLGQTASGQVSFISRVLLCDCENCKKL